MALNEQAKHVTHMMTEARARGAEVIETTVEAEDSWVSEMKRAQTIGRRFYSECTPGYYNNEGKLGSPIGFFAGTYVEGPIKFFNLLEDWRAEGNLTGVELK
jgi:cyclohexanone monooxygenase